jgi:nucleotidyltransferase AbiEii toxin of type IV toxin-antitoxin system
VFRGILTEAQQTVLELLSRVGEVRTFYLAGGTALTLHLGHRRSRDFGFFHGKDFLPQDLLSSLREARPVRVLQEATGTLMVMLREVPTSFFRYDYPLLRPLHESPWSLSVADPEDIAAMKPAALAGRGSRKDFVDLYVYTRNVAPLEQIFSCFREKYRGVSVDPYHLVRSLTFFEDAEGETMPEMLVPVAGETSPPSSAPRRPACSEPFPRNRSGELTPEGPTRKSRARPRMGAVSPARRRLARSPRWRPRGRKT